MPGGADFPEIDDAVSAVDGGHDDDVRSTVGSEISAAKFVDNSIHHAVYEISTHSSGRYMTVGRPNSSDFQVTHERAYDFKEEEESLLLTHTTTPGVKDDVPVFFTDTRLQTGSIPPFLLSTNGKRIRPHSVTTADKGSRLNLRNLQGKTLGLGEGQVVTRQPVNVGLRTSDLIMRLFRNKTTALNSISVGRPFTGSSKVGDVTTYKGGSFAKHSTNFLAVNFISTTIPDAIRFISRHDNYIMSYDRYGNLIYGPEGFSYTDTKCSPSYSAQVREESIVDAANKVIVKGHNLAINDQNEVSVSDVELQKRDGIVKTSKYFDPLARTRTSSRRSANQFLRLNRKAQGSVKLANYPSGWYISPGDIVDYKGIHDVLYHKRAVIEVIHQVHIGFADIQLISYELGIERLLQNFSKNIIPDNDSIMYEPVKKLELGGGGETTLVTIAKIGYRTVSGKLDRINSDPSDYNLTDTGDDAHSGFLIGHRNYDIGNATGRSAIGTGLTPRLAGGSHSSGTITVSSTTGFPNTGYLIVNEAIHIQYTGITSTTFTGATVQAPSGASIPSSGLSIRLFRTRGHEMRTVKGLTIGKVL